MTDEERKKAEAVGNRAAESGDPEVMQLASWALQGDEEMLEQVLEIWADWEKEGVFS